jgi:hypothetical protein
MWKEYVTAARTADYQDPELDRYAAGGGLSVLTHGLYEEHQDGDVTLGQPKFDPVATIEKTFGADATQVKVSDCADGSRWLNYHGGKIIPGQAAGHRRIIAQVQPFSGTWKVTYLNVGKAGTCLPVLPGAPQRRSRLPWH